MAFSRIADVSTLRVYGIKITIYLVAYRINNKWINQESCIRNVFTTAKLVLRYLVIMIFLTK